MSLPALEQPLPDVDQDAYSPFSRIRVVDASHAGYQHWLVWLQKLLSASVLGLYTYEHSKSNVLLNQHGIWPEQAVLSPWATNVAIRAVETCALLQARHKDEPSHSVVCVPNVSAADPKRVKHVLVIERNANTKLDPQTQARLAIWAFDSLDRFVANQEDLPSSNQTSTAPGQLEHLHKCSSVSTFAQCAAQLAELSGAERCVIAKLPLKKERARGADLLAVSGQPHVDKRLSASRNLVQIIDKEFKGKKVTSLSIVENDTVLASVVQSAPLEVVQRAQRLLVPVLVAQQWFVVSLERLSKKPFCDAELPVLESACRSLLNMAVLADPATFGVGAAITRSVSSLRLKVAQHLPAYVGSSVLAAGLLVFLLYPVEHLISAPLNVEAAEQHVLIAPVDAFVKTVAVTAGDQVRKGQILAELDDRELKLQLQKLQSEALQNQQAYSQVLALHDRVEVSRLREEGLLIETELSRLNLQREKMVLKAPVDGVVLSGSWDDFLGAAVAAGDTLFSLGSDSSHRLVLDISEYDVSRVRSSQAVSIRLAADPSTVLDGKVTAIMPLAIAKAGSNSVQVHARLEHDRQLRPGMQGIGKVLVGKQSRLLQWFERFSARIVWLGWKLGVLR